MNSQFFIPERIKVGFQNRSDTYNVKLAYVIYFDKKNVLRKEKSWDSWRNKDIEPVEYKNEPTEGFVLNKKIGGHKSGWNHRNAYIRIYDPRNFEFEISVENLLFILKECDCSRGKGLEGKFVYSWHGTELVLLPINCEDYKNSVNFTSLQEQTVKAKELIKGATYITKRQQELVYLGKFDYYRITGSSYGKKKAPCTKEFIFWDGKNCIVLDKIKELASVINETSVGNYSELVDKYYKSPFGSKVLKLYLKEAQISDGYQYFVLPENDSFVLYRCSLKDGIVTWAETYYVSKLVDGFVETKSSWSDKVIEEKLKGPKYKLWATFESGSEYELEGYGFKMGVTPPNPL